MHAADERSNFERRPEHYSYPPPPPSNHNRTLEQKKSSSLRTFFGIGHSSRDSVDQSQHANNTKGLGRRSSVRRSGTPGNLSIEEQQRLQGQGYPARTSSRQNLPASPEVGEDNYDPFQIRPDAAPPVARDQDTPIEFYTQQPQRNHYSHQQPPLVRVDTGHSRDSYYTQGSTEQYHQEGQEFARQQLNRTSSYTEPQLHQQQLQQLQPEQYQSYHPTPLHSPIPAHPQLSPGAPIPPSLQQQQEIQYVQPPPPRQEDSPPQHYYRTEQHDQEIERPSLENRRSQALKLLAQQQQGDQSRSSSRPTSEQYSSSETDQELQPLDREQPLAARLQQARDRVKAAEAEKSGELMAQRKSVHLGEASNQNMPPAHRREESNLSQNQGQVRSPQGVPAFGANVVPKQSQGQPYRGQGQNQGQPDSEMGRGTPPPRSANDGNEGDLATQHRELQNEYKTLRKWFCIARSHGRGSLICMPTCCRR